MKYKISKEDFYRLISRGIAHRKKEKEKIYYGYLNEQKLKRKPRKIRRKKET